MMIIIIIIVFISIRARCHWPQLLRCPCQRSFCLFVCFFLAKLIVKMTNIPISYGFTWKSMC